MNEWAQKTLKIVEKEDYLDKLQKVYPHEDAPREIDHQSLEEIRNAFQDKNNDVLIKKLLDLPKFPYKDSYVGFLRTDREAIKRNPETVKRICDTLYQMGINGVIDGISKPKEANTRRGQQFTNWLKKKFEFVNTGYFEKSKKGILVLDVNEKEARDFCNKVLGAGISKRPDLVAKSGAEYIIGEAKFLSSSGGNQGRAFDDGMKLAANPSGKAHKIFILDGIHWIESGSEQFNQIQFGNAAILSVLLLGKYLKTVNSEH